MPAVFGGLKGNRETRRHGGQRPPCLPQPRETCPVKGEEMWMWMDWLRVKSLSTWSTNKIVTLFP